MIIFRRKALNFIDVVNFLKTTKYLFDTLFKDGVYSSGLHLDYKALDVEDIEGLISVLNDLIEEFYYQFIFGYVDGKIIKFNYKEFISTIKPKSRVELFMQPTTKVNIDKLTEYIPKSYLYHATDSSNLSSILGKGLLPKGRSQGELGYNYYPAVHLLTDLNGMVKLDLSGNLVGAKNWKSNLVLIEVNPEKNRFILDPASDVGAITYEKIIPDNLRVVDKSEYEDLFKSRSIPDYEMFGKNKFISIKKIT